MSNSLIYLASPYSHPDEKIRVNRFESISIIAAKLMSKGLLIFCPIAHTHPICIYGKLEVGFDFWKKYDEIILARCDRFIICPLIGWEASKGIKGEIEIWKQLNKGPIEILNTDTLKIKEYVQ